MMSMRCFAVVAVVVVAATCGPDPNAVLPGFLRGAGGEVSGAGGTTDTGGTTVVGEGGSASGGGHKGTGGAGSGGKSGTGGRAGAGDASAEVGRDGSLAGRDLAAARDSSGGGGKIGGGEGGAGGTERSDALIVARDTALSTPDAAGSCINDVVANGYACGSATSCAGCVDINGASKTAGCTKAIDCLAKAGASCDSNCQLNCLNQAGDQPAQACVTALQKAACSADGCGATVVPDGGS